jgi:Secretion system C-terminal sorting domain
LYYIAYEDTAWTPLDEVSFSHDGKYVVGGNYDGSVIIWETTLTGVNDVVLLKNDIKISPLPADKQFIISYEMQNGGWADITVSDMLGRIVYNSRDYLMPGKQEKTISCENWSTGIYYARISMQNGTKCVPVVISR